MDKDAAAKDELQEKARVMLREISELRGKNLMFLTCRDPAPGLRKLAQDQEMTFVTIEEGMSNFGNLVANLDPAANNVAAMLFFLRRHLNDLQDTLNKCRESITRIQRDFVPHVRFGAQIDESSTATH